MSERSDLNLAGQPDRLRVFVSSTIGECAAQRAHAAEAIRTLGQDHFIFEREGARTYGPRALYLGKLRTCHFAIGIYRQSYGWVDEANGLTLSGLDDEFQEIDRLDLDLLAYIEKGVDRDPRLQTMLDTLLSKRTAHFFEADDDLTDQIRCDMLTLLAQRFAQNRIAANQRAVAPQLTIESVFRSVPYRVERRALQEALGVLCASHRANWIVGAAGAGKTVLAAEFAIESRAPYVNARGLDPRTILAKASDALAGRAGGESYSPNSFDEARATFEAAWSAGQKWPLVIDDASDSDLLWSEIAAMLAKYSVGSVVFASRAAPAAFLGGILAVEGFTAQEFAQLDALVEGDARRNLAAFRRQTGAVLPLDVRSAMNPLRAGGIVGSPILQRFAQLSGAERDILSYLALAQAPLSLEDMARLRDAPGDLAGLADLLSHLDDIIVEDAIGYSILHDQWASEIAENLVASTQYRAALAGRLVDLFADTDRAWRGFLVARDTDPSRAVLLAEQSLREIFFSGSVRNLTAAQQFLADHYRQAEMRAPLIQMLVSLAQIASHARDEAHCWALLDEADATANQIGDAELIDYVTRFKARYRLQTVPTLESLAAIESLREALLERGDDHEAAQLLIDEGVAFMSINRGEDAVPRFRQALALFEELDDQYGRDIAARNIAAILLANGGEDAGEGERLLAALAQGKDEPAERHRAWMCNTLNRRYRTELRFEEAEAVAREAIALGKKFGDRYVTGINLLALGNTMRDVERWPEAIEAYGAAAAEAQAISRLDLDGRAARLTASCYNKLASDADGEDAQSYAEKAESFARHAISRLQNSLASYDLADAWDELSDALMLQHRLDEGLDAAVEAVIRFGQAGEPEAVCGLTRSLAHQLADQPFEKGVALLLKAHGKVAEEKPLANWVTLIGVGLAEANIDAAASIFALLMRYLRAVTPPFLRALTLDRCLRLVASKHLRAAPGHRARLLLNILAFFGQDDLGRLDLLRLASLTLEGDRQVRMRDLPDAGLHQVVFLGEQKQHLFTVHTFDDAPEAVFLALYISNFLAAFADTLSNHFLGPLAPEGSAIEILVGTTESLPESLRGPVLEQFARRPVGFAAVDKAEGEYPCLFAVAEPGLLSKAVARADRVGIFEMIGMDMLSMILQCCFETNLDAPEFREPSKRIVRRMLW